ncbi:hypothetical protein EKD02_08185 [Chlorobium phaeovibrioides]|uniref:Uncharacterized protein n=2 Tax=Chlorobium phaeovibrioides TaxID=1094 RepID=A0A432ATN3_CHLPH|nr:hypothetical protein EKD02_08185 [Chlorobium phaeovibrioides]
MITTLAVVAAFGFAGTAAAIETDDVCNSGLEETTVKVNLEDALKSADDSSINDAYKTDNSVTDANKLDVSLDVADALNDKSQDNDIDDSYNQDNDALAVDLTDALNDKSQDNDIADSYNQDNDALTVDLTDALNDKSIANSYNQDNDALTATITVNDVIVSLGAGDAVKVNGNYVEGSIDASMDINSFSITNNGNATAPSTAIMPVQTTTTECCNTTVTESLASVPGSMTVNQSGATFDSAIGFNNASAAFQAFSSPTVLVTGGGYGVTPSE